MNASAAIFLTTNNMKKALKLFVAIVCVSMTLAIAGCSTYTNSDDLIIGTWDVTSYTHIVSGYPNDELNGTFTEQLPNEWGESMRFTFQKNKTFVSESTDNDYSDIATGTYRVIGDTLMLTYGQYGDQRIFYQIDKLDIAELTISRTDVFQRSCPDGNGELQECEVTETEKLIMKRS